MNALNGRLPWRLQRPPASGDWTTVERETIEARHGPLWLVSAPAAHWCTLDIREISSLANCVWGTTFRGCSQQSSLANAWPTADCSQRTTFAQQDFFSRSMKA
jgi:transposase InsO family protein